MTLSKIRSRVMFQTNNDIEDLGEYQPHLEAYINEGYDKLLYAYEKSRVGDDDRPALVSGADEPMLPEWLHSAIADYATYMLYRNGNAPKQSRGMLFYQSFNDAVTKARSRDDKPRKIINVFKY